MSITIQTITWSDVKTGDTVLFADTPYVVQAIGGVIDGTRSVIFADTNDGNPYCYQADSRVNVIPATETPARPMIDFSGSSRATAREYAAVLKSRSLAPEHNTRLQNVADGHAVDAYDLNATLTAAMSLSATRASQSMERRQYTKRVRHLAHIVQAVLENHADGLPAYAEGDRSRAVEDAKQALEGARLEIDRLVAVLAERDANFERAIIEAGEADAAWSQKVRDLEGDRNRAESDAEELSLEVKDLRDQVRVLSLTIGYTRGLGNARQSAQSLGYQHGLEGR